MARSARLSGPNTTWCRSTPVRRRRCSADAVCLRSAVTFADGVALTSKPCLLSLVPPLLDSCSTSPTTSTAVAASAKASSGANRSTSWSTAIASSSSCTASSVSTSRCVPRTAALTALSAFIPSAEPIVRRSRYTTRSPARSTWSLRYSSACVFPVPRRP